MGTSQTTTAHFSILHHFDHLLLDKASWPALRPDVVLQLGGHMISKRCMQFLEWAALGGPDRSGWVGAGQEGGCLWCTLRAAGQMEAAVEVVSSQVLRAASRWSCSMLELVSSSSSIADSSPQAQLVTPF